MAKVIVWENGKKIKRDYDPAIDAPVRPSPEKLEAQIQRAADDITKNSERDVAMANATVDLVMAAAEGKIKGRSRAQVLEAYREQVVEHLRKQRGVYVRKQRGV